MSDTVLAIIVALVSGTGGWGLLQFLFNRTDRQANRTSLLAEAQATAQRVALESANATNVRMERESENCQRELAQMRKVTEALVRAIGALMDRAVADRPLTVSASEMDTVFSAMRDARDHLF